MSKAIEAAAAIIAEEQECVPCWHAEPGGVCGCVFDAKRVIRAFLEAAHEDHVLVVELAKVVSGAPFPSKRSRDKARAAILSLKAMVET